MTYLLANIRPDDVIAVGKEWNTMSQKLANTIGCQQTVEQQATAVSKQWNTMSQLLTNTRLLYTLAVGKQQKQTTAVGKQWNTMSQSFDTWWNIMPHMLANSGILCHTCQQTVEY